MALSELKSNLSSLKFGDSRPIIRHEIGNTVSQASARLDDVKRLAGILTKAPGLKFAANQTLLQSTKIANAAFSKKGVGNMVLAGLGAAFKATVGTGLFLTSNAGKAGTGFHSVNPSVSQSYLTDGPAANPITGGDTSAGGFLNKAIAAVSSVATAIGAQSANYHAAKEVLGGGKVSKNYTNPKYKDVGKDQGKTLIFVDNSRQVKKEVRSNAYKEFDDATDERIKYLEKTDIKDKQLPKYYTKDVGDTLQGTQVLSEALDVDEQDIVPFVFNFYTPGENTDKFLYFSIFRQPIRQL